MIPKFEDLTYPERAELSTEDPNLYRALKDAFERRAARDIRNGLITREHRAWLYKLAVREGKKQIEALQSANSPEEGGKVK